MSRGRRMSRRLRLPARPRMRHAGRRRTRARGRRWRCRRGRRTRRRCAAHASCANAGAKPVRAEGARRDRPAADPPEPAVARRGPPPPVRAGGRGHPGHRRVAGPARPPGPTAAARHPDADRDAGCAVLPVFLASGARGRGVVRGAERGGASAQGSPGLARRGRRRPRRPRSGSCPAICPTPTASAARAGSRRRPSSCAGNWPRMRPRVPARERRRRPRVVLVQSNGVSHLRADLVALVDDGARRYTVPLELARARAGWRVTAVGS